MFQIPLQKVDEERRLVIGQAAAECLDKSGESMDYATAKAAFQKWSDEFERTSGGLSKGNLRVMHTKEVAGKIVDLSFDDLTKSVNIVAHVASDNAWNLVKSGCYGGFSIGGGYAKRWTDENGLKKYTPDVREISLVDNPCIPSARFVELIKAHGVIEHIELKPTTRPLTFAELYENRPLTFAEMADTSESLKKFGQHDWSEAKHPRNHGKFASSAGASGAAAPAAAPKKGFFADLKLGTDEEEKARADAEKAEAKRQDEMPGRMNVAAAAAAAGAGATQLGQTALTNRHKVVDAVKYGMGEKGVRNKTAARLRGSPLARDRIKAGARTARTEALNDAAPAGGDDLGSKAKRKVMEEATARGSSPEEAQAAGERFAEKLRNRKGSSKTVGDMFVNGKATRQVSPKAAANATRAAKNRMRGSILTENFHTQRGAGTHGFAGGGLKGLMRSYALSMPLGVIGSALGAQSAWRLQREDEGHEVTPAQHRAANAGDALRVARNVGAGASAGAFAGIAGSFFHQGGSVRNVKAFLESGSKLNPAKVAAHSKLGSAIGAGVGLAASIPSLARENVARRKSKDS